MTSNLLRLSEEVSLALHAMVLLAGHPGQRFCNSEIAALLGASEHTVAKVMQRLAKERLVESVRGPHGGFSLAKSPEAVTLSDIYEAIDGPIGVPSCLLGKPVCSGQGCLLAGLVQSVHQQVKDYLVKTSLARLSPNVHLGNPASPDLLQCECSGSPTTESADRRESQ